MAAIDKIYLNYNEALEFFDWINKHNNEFLEEFSESGCKSLNELMYFNEAKQEYWADPKNERPVCNLPMLVERWMLKHDDLPKGAKDELFLNYGLRDKSEEEIRKFIDEPLEEEDSRPMSNNFKIISRSGWFRGCNWGSLFYTPCSHVYYREQLANKYNIDYSDAYSIIDKVDEYTKSLMDDCWVFYDEINDVGNLMFRKKKHILQGWSSMFLPFKSKSLKSIFRHIRKFKWPVGTIIRIEDRKYVGEVLIKIVK